MKSVIWINKDPIVMRLLEFGKKIPSRVSALFGLLF